MKQSLCCIVLPGMNALLPAVAEGRALPRLALQVGLYIPQDYNSAYGLLRAMVRDGDDYEDVPVRGLATSTACSSLRSSPSQHSTSTYCCIALLLSLCLATATADGRPPQVGAGAALPRAAAAAPQAAAAAAQLFLDSDGSIGGSRPQLGPSGKDFVDLEVLLLLYAGCGAAAAAGSSLPAAAAAPLPPMHHTTGKSKRLCSRAICTDAGTSGFHSKLDAWPVT
jgi:hypothetical protein